MDNTENKLLDNMENAIDDIDNKLNDIDDNLAELNDKLKDFKEVINDVNEKRKPKGIKGGFMIFITFIIFLVLKLTVATDLHWWFVTSPLWAPIAFALLLGIVLCIKK